MANDFLDDFANTVIEQRNPYIVYAKTNENGYITAVNSSEFLADTTGWVEIDSGYGDKHHHAQNNYFPESVKTLAGAYRYKLEDGKPVECTPEEIQAQEEANKPDPVPTQEERIAELEAQNAMLMECLLEMSEIVYA